MPGEILPRVNRNDEMNATDMEILVYHCSAKNPGGNASSTKSRDTKAVLFREMCANLNTSRLFSSSHSFFSLYRFLVFKFVFPSPSAPNRPR